MEITKENLEGRIEELMGQANNLLAQYNQILGGIAYCHQLIADLEEELPTAEEAVSQLMPGAEVLEVIEDEETVADMIEKTTFQGADVERLARGVAVNEA